MPLHFDYFSESINKEEFISEFSQFPRELYKNNPEIKTLSAEIEKMYFKFHPLPHDFILIKDDGKIILRSMVCLTPLSEIAYFGLLDFDSQYTKIDEILALFKTQILKWCRERGMKKIIGPINFSTWLPYRVASSIDYGPQFSFEPDRPLLYCSLLKKHGFSTNQLFSSKGYEEWKTIIDLTRSDFEKAQSLGYSFNFMPKELNDEDIRDLHRLSVEIFADNYLATPIDFQTFKSLYITQSKKDDLSLSFFILSPQKERIGFFINFLEHNYLVIKTIGISKLHRGAGLSNGSMYLLLTKASELGIHQMVAALVKEGAQSESYGKKMKLQWTHLYEILELAV